MFLARYLSLLLGFQAMWAKAVWREDPTTQDETVGTLPESLIEVNKKIVWWPNDEKLVLKCYKNKETPRQEWKKFQLVKIKSKSGNAKFICESKPAYFSPFRIPS